MLISELINENDMDAATQRITQHMHQQWLKQQQSQQAPQQTAPVAAPAAPEKVVTPDMIAKHPQYKAWYDKYLAMELPKSSHRGAAEMQAKKYADSKISSLIRAGK
jgi:hypothetical protein